MCICVHSFVHSCSVHLVHLILHERTLFFLDCCFSMRALVHGCLQELGFFFSFFSCCFVDCFLGMHALVRGCSQELGFFFSFFSCCFVDCFLGMHALVCGCPQELLLRAGQSGALGLPAEGGQGQAGRHLQTSPQGQHPGLDITCTARCPLSSLVKPYPSSPYTQGS